MENKIINKKGLKELICSVGGRRVDSGAEEYLLEKINEGVKRLVKGMVEEMVVNGRRTLKKEDVEKVFDSDVEFKDF